MNRIQLMGRLGRDPEGGHSASGRYAHFSLATHEHWFDQGSGQWVEHTEWHHLVWIASMIMRTNAQQGMLLNIVVGVIGSMLGGWLIAPMLGSATVNQNDFSVRGLLSSLIGAVILLAIVNLVRRGAVR